MAGSAANREDRRHNRGPKRFIVGAVALIIGGLLTAGALGDERHCAHDEPLRSSVTPPIFPGCRRSCHAAS